MAHDGIMASLSAGDREVTESSSTFRFFAWEDIGNASVQAVAPTAGGNPVELNEHTDAASVVDRLLDSIHPKQPSEWRKTQLQ